MLSSVAEWPVGRNIQPFAGGHTGLYASTSRHTLRECEPTHTPLVLQAVIQQHTDSPKPQHTPSTKDTFAVPLHQMSCPHFRLFLTQLHEAVVGRSVTGTTEHLSKGCCGLQGTPAFSQHRKYCPVGHRTAAWWGMPGIMDMLLLLPVLLSTRHSKPWTTELVWWPVQFAAATAYIINVTVCVKDWPCSQAGSSIDYMLWSSPNCMNKETE